MYKTACQALVEWMDKIAATEAIVKAPSAEITRSMYDQGSQKGVEAARSLGSRAKDFLSKHKGKMGRGLGVLGVAGYGMKAYDKYKDVQEARKNQQ